MTNNEKIAYFMGFQKTNLGWYDNDEVLNLPYTKDNTFDTLLFDKSWDWLMPVYKEMITLVEKDLFHCYGISSNINTVIDLAEKALLKGGISKTYKFLCQAIEVYNNELNGVETPFWRATKVDNTILSSVEIQFHCVIEREQYDLGAVTLECNGRQAILDIVESVHETDNNYSAIRCQLSIDRETFDNCKYDLTSQDLLSPFLKGTLFIGDSYEVEPDSITLFVRSQNCVKAIDLGVK